MHDINTSDSTNEVASQDGAPPCHQTADTNQSDNQNQHCEGVCLCVHVSSSPLAFIKNSESMRLPVMAKQFFSSDADMLASVTQTPPKRPPKYIS